MNSRAKGTFSTIGKFAQQTAALIPGVIGKKCKQTLRTNTSIIEHTRGVAEAVEAKGSLCQPFRGDFAGHGLVVSED